MSNRVPVCYQWDEKCLFTPIKEPNPSPTEGEISIGGERSCFDIQTPPGGGLGHAKWVRIGSAEVFSSFLVRHLLFGSIRIVLSSFVTCFPTLFTLFTITIHFHH